MVGIKKLGEDNAKEAIIRTIELMRLKNPDKIVVRNSL